MPNNEVVAPQGAVVVGGNAGQSAPREVSASSGVTVGGSGNAAMQDDQQQDGGTLHNLWTGAKAGLSETATGLSHVLNRDGSIMNGASEQMGNWMESAREHLPSKLGGVSHEEAEAFRGTTATQGQEAAQQGSEELLNGKEMQTTAGKIGYGGEMFLEFLLGDEALKGLSTADKLLQAGKVAKILEGSPRLMEALKVGANMSKAKSLLDPAAKLAMEKSPILGRLVSAGMDAIRSGAVQFGQTAAKTGVQTLGDVGQAGKDALVMGGTSAVLGGAMGAAGGALERGGKAAQTVGEMNRIAENAPSKQGATDILRNEVGEAAKAKSAGAEGELHTAVKDIAELGKAAPSKEAISGQAQGMVNEADATMHQNYDALEQEANAATAGSAIDYRGSAMEKSATNYQTGVSTNATKNPLDRIIKGREPEGQEARGKLKGLLDMADPAAPNQSMDSAKLFEYRKDLAARLREMPWKDKDRPFYQEMLDGVDSTINDLMHRSGNPELIDKYTAAKQAYGETKALFKNNDVKAIMDGNVHDVMARLARGDTAPADIENLKKLIGDQNMNQLGVSYLERMAADSVDKATGKADYEKLFKDWSKFGGNNGDAVKKSIFGESAAQTFTDVLNKATNASKELKAVNEAMADAMTGNTDTLLRNPDRVRTLVDYVGPDGAKRIGRGILESKIAESASALGKDGKIAKGARFDSDAVLEWWKKLKDSPEVRNSLFTPDAQTAKEYEALMAKLSNVSSMKTLVKFSILPLAGTAGVVHSPFSMFLATLAGAAGSQLGPVRDILDHIANSPATWKAWAGGSAVARNAAVKGAGRVGKVAAGKVMVDALSPDSAKARVFSGATGLQ